MVVHKDMVLQLVEKHGVGHSLEEANEMVKLEIERICREILNNTAVYKDTEEGIKGFIQFLNSNGYELI